VRIEPYPTPNIIRQELRGILDAVEFADDISFGGWNYNPVVRKYSGAREFYREQERIVEEFCRQRKKQWHAK
jgi:hypothetical protein